MNNIIKLFIIFQNFSVLRYLDKYFERYPNKKKNIKDDIDAPIPKRIFWVNKKSFEKFPRKKTVSE